VEPRERDESEEIQVGREAPGSEGKSHRRIIAVGGGKGGVGKSLLAANLGIYLAQLGKKVVLIDADLGGANLHTFLGVERPSVTLGNFFDKRVARIEDCIVETSVKGLGLVSGEGDPLWAANPRPATKNRLINQVRELDVDWLICDLPPGSGFIALDFFLVADVGLLVVNPEPTSVENTYRFIKSAFLRRLRDVRGLDGLGADRTSEGGIPAPLDLYQAARASGDDELAQRVLDEMQRFRPRVVVNQVRTRADLDLGPQLSSAGRRRFGVSLEDLGALETDDAVWQAVRKRRPLVVEFPESRIAKSIERIARKLLAPEPHHPEPPKPPRPTEEQTLYEVLEIDPGASDEEIRRAHRRAKDIYADDSMVVCGLFTPERLAIVQDRVEKAHDTLLDPDKRKSLDLKLFPDGIPSRPTPASGVITSATGATGPTPVSSSAARDRVDATPLKVKVEIPEPPITPDTEFTGELLRQLREARGVELIEISQKTKVGAGHLKAIEEERWSAMPALVYLRGFLVEYARFMRLDVNQVTRTYLARYHRARAANGD
jgi:flagellar biosynthesis protein FlhG